MSKNRLLTRRRALWLGLGTLAGIGATAGGRAMYENLRIQSLNDPKRDFSVVGDASLIFLFIST